MALSREVETSLKIAMTPGGYAAFLGLDSFTETDVEAVLAAQGGNVKLAAAEMLGALVNLADAGGGKIKLGPLEVAVPTEQYAARATQLRAEVEIAVRAAVSEVAHANPAPVFEEWGVGP